MFIVSKSWWLIGSLKEQCRQAFKCMYMMVRKPILSESKPSVKLVDLLNISTIYKAKRRPRHTYFIN